MNYTYPLIVALGAQRGGRQLSSRFVIPGGIGRGLNLLSLLAGSCLWLFATGGSPASPGDASRPNELIIAVLGLENRTTRGDLGIPGVIAEHLIVSALREVGGIHVLRDLDDEPKRLGLPEVKWADESQARKLGDALSARWVVWGTCEQQEKLWTVRARLLEVPAGTQAKEVTVAASDWQQIGQQLTLNILKELGLRPSGGELQRMREHWATPRAALESYAEARLLRLAGKPLTEQEDLLRRAIRAAPQFAQTYVALASVLGMQGKSRESEEAARAVLKLQPALPSGHTLLGFALATQGRDAEAEVELRAAARLSPGDAATLIRLAFFYGHQGRYSDAVDELKKALKLNPHGYFAGDIKEMLAGLTALIGMVPPADYTEAAFARALRQKLTSEELGLVANPLVLTPEMDRLAVQLTVGATNDETKARLLFERLAEHARASTQSKEGSVRTAAEAFAALNNPQTRLYCKDYAFLYEAMARAVGIRAYDVYVPEAAGQPGEHACAAVFIGGKGFLVDPTSDSFVSTYQHFLVLNDLQATALYLSQLPTMKPSEIACKLAPELPLVQLNLFEKVASEGRLDEARRLLPAIKRLYTNTPTEDYVESAVALLEGHTERAISLLRKATSLNSSEANYHLRLAYAYAQEGRLDEARESCRSALSCPLTALESAAPRKYISDTNALAAWGCYGRGLVAQNRGDLAGALRSYDEAISFNPGYAEAYAARATVREATGDKIGAAQDLSRADQVGREGSRP